MWPERIRGVSDGENEMNSNQREHSYGDLREVVIEVMVGAGDHGVNSFESLLEKTALKLNKRNRLEAGRQHLPSRAASQLHPNGSSFLKLSGTWSARGFSPLA
jgi:hypothetical protein